MLKKRLVVSAILFAVLATGFTTYLVDRARNPVPFMSTINQKGGGSCNPVGSSDVLLQSFQAWKDGLNALILYEVAPRQGGGRVHLRLLNADRSELQSADVDIADFHQVGSYTWTFNRQDDSAGKQYFLEVSGRFDQSDDAIALLASGVTMSPMTRMWWNGQDVDGTMVLDCSYLLGAEWQSALLGYLLCAAVALFAAYFHSIRRWLQKQRLELVLLAIGLPLGLYLVVIQPPLHLFDEDVHFPKAYQVSQGHIHGKYARMVPQYIADGMSKTYRSIEGKTQNPMILREWLKEKPVGSMQSTVPSATTTYSFIGYLPSAVFIRLGTLFHISYLGQVYLARMGNLLFFLTLCALAIRITPVGKSVFFLLALLPIPFNQGLCIGIDAVSDSSAYLFVALVLRFATDKKVSLLSWKLFWALLLTGLFVITGKYVYAPVLLCVFLIPIGKFGDKRRFATMMAISVAVCALYIAYMLRISGLSGDSRGGEEVNFSGQLAYLMVNPLRALQVTFQTLWNGAFVWGNQFAYLSGTYITMGLVSYLQPMIVGYYAIATGGAVQGCDTDVQALPGRTRVLFAMIFVVTLPLIVLPLYLSFTPVGAAEAAGMQGRYFLPILPLLLMALANPWHKRTEDGYQQANLILISAAMLLVNVYTVATSFY